MVHRARIGGVDVALKQAIPDVVDESDSLTDFEAFTREAFLMRHVSLLLMNAKLQGA